MAYLTSPQPESPCEEENEPGFKIMKPVHSVRCVDQLLELQITEDVLFGVTSRAGPFSDASAYMGACCCHDFYSVPVEWPPNQDHSTVSDCEYCAIKRLSAKIFN